MFLSVAPGEPNYVPDSLLGLSHDGADTNSSPFLQCYGRELLVWELMCFFSGHEEDWSAATAIATELERPLDQIVAKLPALADTRLLEQRILPNGLYYRLTQVSQLRRVVLRLGSEWRWAEWCTG